MASFLKKYGILLLLVLVAVFLLRQLNPFPSITSLFRSKPVLIDQTPVIIRQISSLSQLITVTYADEVVMDTAKIGNGMPSLLPTPLGTLVTPGMDKLVIIGKGKVIAGTDLTKIRDSDILAAGDSVQIRIPHARILQTIMNPSDFEIFDEKGDWSEKAVTGLKTRIRREIALRAIRQQVLQQADERAKNIMETFLKSTGFHKVGITFSP